MSQFNFTSFRKSFPIFNHLVNEMPLVYFDNAATTQKPSVVIQAQNEVYQRYNANVHRSAHALSAVATEKFEQARKTVQAYIGAKYPEEVIWTSGTTEAINLVAQSWGETNLKPGDEIVLSYSEHHANIVPWQIIAERTGAKIVVFSLDKSGRIDKHSIAALINKNTKIICCAHISNVIGKINPIEHIITVAKKYNALTLIDGAQACGHIPINVQQLGCDFYVFSAHKVYGPTGVGVLYGRKELLENMPPYQTGGEMIKRVSFSGSTFNQLPYKFEAGTPNIAGVIACATAIKFVDTFTLASLTDYEQKLRDYAFEQLSGLDQINFVAEGAPDIALFSFTVDGFHNHDIASGLDAHGVAVRSGHHCAMPLMEHLGLTGCIRISLFPYNSFAEIDVFITTLKALISPIKSPDDSPSTPSLNVFAQQDEIKSEVLSQYQQVLQRFEQVKGWDGRHREIMLLGKQLVRCDKTLRTEQSLISGCESQAWLGMEINSSGQCVFHCDSDAKVIRGLLVIVLAAYQEKTPKQIQAFDHLSYFERLGLLQHLSPSRGNGLHAIVARIKELSAL